MRGQRLPDDQPEEVLVIAVHGYAGASFQVEAHGACSAGDFERQEKARPRYPDALALRSGRDARLVHRESG